VYCWPACEMRASGRELISPHPLNYDDLINAVGSFFFLSFFWYTATQTTTGFFLFLVVKKTGKIKQKNAGPSQKAIYIYTEKERNKIASD
jgi:hypothetical protein